ncbi:hypothetical protein [Seonamhaeicola sediminis]|uniref:hypothetical protein n=1 Tax=Seonamhaeicola sediminis TaxID=2528206 RepID=UPI00164817C6|nr:hypothetical protein [Seonamhaeicola sediminis]
MNNTNFHKSKKQTMILLVLAVLLMVFGYLYTKSNDLMGGIIFGSGLGIFCSNAFRLIK